MCDGTTASPNALRRKFSSAQAGTSSKKLSGREKHLISSNKVKGRASEYVPSGNKRPGWQFLNPEIDFESWSIVPVFNQVLRPKAQSYFARLGVPSFLQGFQGAGLCLAEDPVGV